MIDVQRATVYKGELPAAELSRGPEGVTFQLAGLYPADKYRMSAAEVIDVVSAACSAPAVARRAVFQQFAFSWLTGNGDLHAKNVSVLRTADGQWRVAPIYDIPSSLPYGDLTSALAVAGRRENLTRRTFLRLADEIDLPQRAAASAIDQALKATAKLPEGLIALGYGRKATSAWERQLQRRRRDMSA